MKRDAVSFLKFHASDKCDDSEESIKELIVFYNNLAQGHRSEVISKLSDEEQDVLRAKIIYTFERRGIYRMSQIVNHASKAIQEKRWGDLCNLMSKLNRDEFDRALIELKKVT